MMFESKIESKYRKLRILVDLFWKSLSLFFVMMVGITQARAEETEAPKDGIYINVGNAGVRRVKIAIPIVQVTSDQPNQGDGLIRPPLNEEIASRFKSLFDFTLAFDVLDPKTFPASATAYSVPLPVERWKALGVELVLHGTVQALPEGTATLEFRLYDSNSGQRLLGKRFSSVNADNQDEVIKRFADLTMKALTGEMGVFSTKIAFVASRSLGGAKEVFIADFDGSNLIQVTQDNVPHMSPSWSPDGTKLTYTSFKGGRAGIYMYNLLTRKSYPLSRGEGNTSGASWHPDGKTVAFSRSLKGKTSIYTMQSWDGRGERSLISGSGLEVEPAFSPDGGSLAFASGRFGNPHIFVRNLSSGKDTRITFAGWYNSSPSWRPDGQKLVFAGYDRDIDRYDLFTVNPDGRQLERLTLDKGDNENPSYSPDGRFIVFQSNRLAQGKGKDQRYALYVMTKDGAGQRKLDIPLFDVTMPEWSPFLGTP